MPEYLYYKTIKKPRYGEHRKHISEDGVRTLCYSWIEGRHQPSPPSDGLSMCKICVAARDKVPYTPKPKKIILGNLLIKSGAFAGCKLSEVPKYYISRYVEAVISGDTHPFLGIETTIVEEYLKSKNIITDE